MIIIYNTDSVYSKAVINVLQFKHISYTPIKKNHPDYPEEDLCVIDDQKNIIVFAHSIIQYLDERYPQKPVYPQNVDQKARINMFLYRMFKDLYRKDYDRKELEDLIPAQQFILGDDPSILDLVILPVLIDCCPEAEEYQQRVMETLQ